MKKIASLLLTILLTACLFTGCGDNADPGSAASGGTAGKIAYMTNASINDGGWNLTDKGGAGKADPDISGMVLQAMAKYQDQAAVIVLNDAASVAGVTPPAAEQPPAEQPPADASSEDEPAPSAPVEQEVVVVEKVEKEIVWKPGVRMIVIIASGVVVLASAAVIVATLVKKKPKQQRAPEKPEEAGQ